MAKTIRLSFTDDETKVHEVYSLTDKKDGKGPIFKMRVTGPTTREQRERALSAREQLDQLWRIEHTEENFGVFTQEWAEACAVHRVASEPEPHQRLAQVAKAVAHGG